MKIMRMPRSVDVAITNRCNLKCKYCFHFGSDGDVKEELPTQEWLTFFDELKRNAVLNMTIQGGEPFCRDDLKELICGIAQRNIRFGILTNGSLITGDMARLLASTRRCDQVQVSIDGASSEVHDYNRGKGSFTAALNGIRILKKYGIHLAVRVTITKHNLADLENIAKFLLEDIGLRGFSTNDAFYMGLCKQNFNEIQLDAVEKSTAMDTLLRLNKKYGGRISATAGPLANARHWIMIQRALRHENANKAEPRGRLKSCYGPMTRIGIRADGIMVPCLLMPHLELGRINKDDFINIWQRHPKLKKLRARNNIPLSTFKSCKNCIYIKYCAGGCPAITYAISADEYLPDLHNCLKQFLLDGGKLPDEKLLFRR